MKKSKTTIKEETVLSEIGTQIGVVKKKEKKKKLALLIR